MFCWRLRVVVVLVLVGHEGSSGVALQSTAGVGGGDGVVDGQVPSDAGAEPSEHVCGGVGVLSVVLVVRAAVISSGWCRASLLSVAGGAEPRLYQ